MKRFIVLLILVGLLSGCSGVIMNAKYANLLDQTAAISQETAERAVAGQLTEDEMKAALVVQANVWQMFRDAREGKAN